MVEAVVSIKIEKVLLSPATFCNQNSGSRASQMHSFINLHASSVIACTTSTTINCRQPFAAPPPNNANENIPKSPTALL